MMRYWHAYVRWFDRMMRGNGGIIVFGIGTVLWTLMLSGRLPG